jgi:hypothetical protein
LNKKDPNYAVRVWFSTPEKIDAFKAEAGAYYELPPSECRVLSLWAANEVSARTGIENMLAKTRTRDKFEVVEVRRLN